MPAEPDLLILRDPRESPRRCSLTPLRGMPGIRFVTWRPELELEVGDRTLLHPDGEELSAADAGRGLLLVDSSWRRLEVLLRALRGDPPRRRLPALRTAYPRKSRIHADPARGLASVEALYAAGVLLGAPRPELLEAYHFREAFLAANPELSV